MCSASGMNDDTTNVWPDINDEQTVNLLQVHQQQIQNNTMKQKLINDMIVNDLVVVNGGDVTTQSDAALIRCNFNKASSQIVNSYFLEQSQAAAAAQQQIQRAHSTNSESICNTAVAAILNDSSNEVFCFFQFISAKF